ncbi:hypothetical protein NMA32_003215 [Salmonella enterica]|nr:hypothetical protein [Salmonella enterica]EDV1315158.1 hypothetical protein [Salmonella enterica subsp. enterica]EDV4675957.1 hypothetical protein [Salmonella enterica subsp. enterica serovar Havana]MBZ3839892.1 hypothetical protein [Salmonella enterica subsp. enterica serovar Alachua]HAE8456489.1 hypothetical protein [Salmonella enterica subsp. enterica serovar Wien]EDR0349107.1 hypothetical protein [Salmonella enterica subsp. enterica serovar Kedougou]
MNVGWRFASPNLGIPCGWRCSGSDAFLRFCIHGMNCNEMDLSQVRQ